MTKQTKYTDKEIADILFNECSKVYDLGGLDKLRQLQIMFASMRTHNEKVQFWEAEQLVEDWINRMRDVER